MNFQKINLVIIFLLLLMFVNILSTESINIDFNNSMEKMNDKFVELFPKLRDFDLKTWEKEYYQFMENMATIEMKFNQEYEQSIIEDKLSYISFLHPIMFQFYKEPNETEMQKIYSSEDYKDFMKLKIDLIDKLDVNSMQLKGIFGSEIMSLSLLPERAPSLAERLKVTKAGYEKKLMDFIENSPNNRCRAQLLYDLGSYYGNRKEYEKAKDMLLRLKKEFPEDGNVKAGYIDKHLTSLEIIPGEKAPDFTVRSMQGDEIRLTDYKGKFLFLEYWSYGCVPCIFDVPNINHLFQMVSEDTIQVLAITRGDKNKIVEFSKKHKIKYPIAICEGTVTQKYGICAVPTNFLIDPNGLIVAKDLRGKKLTEIILEEISKYYQ